MKHNNNRELFHNFLLSLLAGFLAAIGIVVTLILSYNRVIE